MTARLFRATLLMVALVAISAGPVLGAEPANGQPPNDYAASTLTPNDRQILARKAALAHNIRGLSSINVASAHDGVIQPDSVCPSADNCDPWTPPSSYILSAYARQQPNYYYCGPAVGQVLSNESWGYNYTSTSGTTTTNNKYTQATIASWMSTTTSGTAGANLANGLNIAVNHTSGFTYYHVLTGTAYELQDKVISDTAARGLGLALPVKPHDPGATYWLTSWPNAVTAWHWIAIRGYSGRYNGTRTALLYYSDSSGGYQGSTGNYSDPTLDMHYVNARNNGYIVW